MSPTIPTRDIPTSKRKQSSEMIDRIRNRRECELCRTRTLTTEEYGMHVCGLCKEKYLP